jgi:hypothetical protein
VKLATIQGRYEWDEIAHRIHAMLQAALPQHARQHLPTYATTSRSGA